jgi:hypothetical protein
MRFESALEIEELEAEFAGLLPQRESLMGLSINVAPVINVDPAIAVGIVNAIGIQVGTTGSTLTTTVNQWVSAYT